VPVANAGQRGSALVLATARGMTTMLPSEMRPVLPAIALCALLAALEGAPATGQALCVRPLAPTCIEVEQTYQSDDERQGCQEEIASYESDVRGYQACLQDEARDAAQVRDRVVARFRCRLSGRTDCGALPDSAANR